RAAIDALVEGRHDDPFALLGVFAAPKGSFARALVPGAETVEAHDLAGASLGPLARIDGRGLFEGVLPGDPQPLKYKAQGFGAEWWLTDPYSF
ncbi:GlgB N-terminal domain-containing protein, partial [Streptococcus suis]